ncbi:proliferating cell nuclear antigen-like protein [Perkinsela sp. CCAP 1560/4]|nr:proliferating cell nuclear antigen-like protein [Perkinsela sp. CCAP 1560/4]|eukprot:KNH05520.1 proliferating cell nuclear antigen-like protein [Perkinsela sp. CCAP 1560/4]
MFEATVEQSDMWKRILEPIKEVVNEANFECSPSGIQLQAMDASHVSLVSLLLRGDGFRNFNCSRNFNLGINFNNMSKVLKCANKEDSVTMRYEETDSVTFLVESTGQEKVSEFTMRLMDIEGESLSIPEQSYSAMLSMPSSEFTKLCRDMSTFGDAVQISVTKDYVKFSTRGDFGQGSTTVKPTVAADVSELVKSEPGETQDASMPVDKTEEGTASRAAISLVCHEDVTLTFALKNLVIFTKGSPLSDRVTLRLAMNEPIQVEYKIEGFGYMRFYLAPKVDESVES